MLFYNLKTADHANLQNHFNIPIRHKILNYQHHVLTKNKIIILFAPRNAIAAT